MKEKILFKNKALKMAGELHLPKNMNRMEKHPAVVVVHPGGGVKEQVAGLYAQKLAENGFIALAFDATHQGESEGEPRFLEDPNIRVEDIRSAVDFLAIQPYVDAARIGALGICAGGGYAVSAAQTEERIKAVGTLSMWDIGGGARGGQTAEDIKKTLEAVARQRTREARGEPVQYVGYVPNSLDEIGPDTPEIMKEGYDYYRTPRARHPNSQNKMMFTNLDRIIGFHPFARIETISPRPILMIVGSRADSAHFSEKAYEKAKEPKELFKIEGASHIDLYDKPEYVAPAVKKLTDFFRSSL